MLTDINTSWLSEAGVADNQRRLGKPDVRKTSAENRVTIVLLHNLINNNN